MYSPWMYEGKPFTEAPKDKIGFVYSILCTTNHREYVGRKQFKVGKNYNWQNYWGSSCSTDFKADLERGKHLFIRTIISIHTTAEDLAKAEICLQTSLDVLKTLFLDGTHRYYNLNIGNEQFRLTPAGIAKLRGQKRSAQANENNRRSHLGKRHTKETKLKQSMAKRGIPQTRAHIEKVRQALTGKRRSPDISLKLSMLRKGIRHSQQHIDNNRLSKLGNNLLDNSTLARYA
jgi:endonuclease SegE-like protein